MYPGYKEEKLTLFQTLMPLEMQDQLNVTGKWENLCFVLKLCGQLSTV